MKVREDIKDFLLTIPKGVILVAATKYVDASIVKKLVESGINNIGENRVDSFLNKYNILKNTPVLWHFIGHLQRNKAKDVINKIDYLHSLDSLELAKIIDKNRTSPLKCFVEVSINLEANKNGVPPEHLESFLTQLKEYKNIEIVGLMMMAKAHSTDDELLAQFTKLKEIKEEMNNKLNLNMGYLSMGMSEDYKKALQAGATHIRLGRILFED